MKTILYARFSPRPVSAQCPACKTTFRVEAGHDTHILSACPRCHAEVKTENCDSCESQLDDLRQYAARNGYEVVGEYSDRALSGSDAWDDRPGMLEASTATKKGMVFLVRSYDRLFRDTDKGQMFIAMLAAKGAEVVSITEPSANGDSMHAKLIRFVFLWVAEYQRQVIIARTKAKMRQHQKNGRRMSAHTPWGWKRDPDRPAAMLIDEGEQATIRKVLAYHAEGVPGREIARRLEAEGAPGRGKKWHHERVRRIIARESRD